MTDIRELEEQSLLEWARAREKVLKLLSEHITNEAVEDSIWNAICNYEEMARERSRCISILAIMKSFEI